VDVPRISIVLMKRLMTTANERYKTKKIVVFRISAVKTHDMPQGYDKPAIT
jgi:hypothetical protein